jgi:carbon starvation protein CstA
MDALALVLISGVCLVIAYLTIGGWLSRRVFRLDDSRPTPAVTEEDGRDYVPTKRSVIFGHHFTSIAGTGPIVGPAIAVMWGWLPAVLWVVLGSIFIGAVHDLGSIVVSLRNKGRSIGDIAGDLLGARARLIFLGILVMGLWIVLAIFGLVIAAVLRQYPQAIFPVVVQVPLALLIGVVIHRTGRSIVLPSVIALGLMYASVIWGDWGPLHAFNATLAAAPMWAWVIGLLVYAYVASVLPVWVLLQPRDYVNALQLITTLVLIVVGLVVAATVGGAPDDTGFGATGGLSTRAEVAANTTVEVPSIDTGATEDLEGEKDTRVGKPPVAPGEEASHRPKLSIVAPMIDWQPEGAPPMLPVLFITIACGACSGFHCLVGSGTTSKQIAKERDAKAVGYGSMLTEGFLATLVIAACCAGIGLGVTRTLPTTVMPLTSSGHIGPNALQSISLPISAAESEAKLIYSFDPNEHRSVTLVHKGSTLRWQHSLTHEVDVEIAGPMAFTNQYESWQAAGSLGKKVGAFVEGAANFVASLGISLSVAIALMAVMVASFAATTMDTACRLQRYVLQELSWRFLPRVSGAACRGCGYDLKGLTATEHFRGRSDGATEQERQESRETAVSTRATPSSLRRSVASSLLVCPECGAEHPAHEVYHHDRDASFARASGLNPFKWLSTVHGATLFAVVTAAALAAVPPVGEAWSLGNAGTGGLRLWPLFGATNQLLAGFAFVVIAAWLIVMKRPWWFCVPAAALMLVAPASAMVWQAFIGNDDNASWVAQGSWTLVVIACATLALEAWLLVETFAHWARRRPFTRFADGA